jgi:hypothetical protein
MKRWISAILTLALMLCFSACGGGSSSDTAKDIDLTALAADLLDSGAFTDLLNQTADNVPAKLYGYDEADVAQCIMYYGTGATAEEILLVQATSSEAAARLTTACQDRVSDQKTAFSSYVPEELPKLDSAVLETVGNYVIFVVSNDAAAVQTIVDGYTT